MKRILIIAERLGAVPEMHDIPIIAVTGVFTEAMHRKVIESYGIKRTITKPVISKRL